jgi:hypothetical protein
LIALVFLLASDAFVFLQLVASTVFLSVTLLLAWQQNIECAASATMVPNDLIY